MTNLCLRHFTIAVAAFFVSSPVFSQDVLIPQSGWSLRSVDSQETDGADNAAVRAFDGNPYTIWATQWAAAAPPPPHDLQIDLGASYTIAGFRYLPRQDGVTYGTIGQYQFSVSSDGVNWGTPVATGTFPATSNEQRVVFTATNARYVRLRALGEVTGQPWTTVAELNVLAAGTTVPGPGTPSGGGGSAFPIPQAGWSLRAVDSQETNGADNWAVRMFDGNPYTIWATQWSDSPPPPPHEVLIDLGATYSVSGFRYLPRQDGVLYGGIGQYQFYVSADGVNWGSAVAAGTFPATSTEQQVDFTPVNARYIVLRALSEISGQPWTVVAELNVLSTSLPPAGTPPPPGPGSGGGDPGGTPISQAGWRLQAVDSQEIDATNNAAVNAFDGNPGTIWATQWAVAAPSPPHELQIDLGAVYAINGFRYLPRQDGALNGGIGQYQFYVSTDGVNWGSAVAAGTFATTSSEQQVAFTTTSGRFVWLRALSEINGQPWSTVAELNVLSPDSAAPPSPGNQLPVVSLSVFQNPNLQSVILAATASDPDGVVTQIDFYSGSTMIRSLTSAPFTAAFSTVASGTYSFVAVARDNLGDRTVSNTVTIAVGAASGASRVLFTPSDDHDTLVRWYGLEIYNAAADPDSAPPVSASNLGKPSVVNGECSADVASILAGLTPGEYVAVVSAVGDVGMSRSAASPAFMVP